MVENLSYREAERDDFKEICKLPQDAEELFYMFPKAKYPLSLSQLVSAVKNRSDSTVILHNDEIVGFANFYEVDSNKYCSIGNVIVNSNFRNKGIGEFLIKTMEHIGIGKYNVSEIHISCFNTNIKGILLYKKLGYKPYDIEKRFYQNNNLFVLIKMKRIVKSEKEIISLR